MATATIPTGTTAKQVIEGVQAKEFTKAGAVKFLKARLDRDVANGKYPKSASRKAYEALSGKEYHFERAQVQTRAQRRKEADLVERTVAESAKPAPKAKAKPKAKGNTVSVDDLIGSLGDQLRGAPQDEIVAAFTKLTTLLRK